MTPKRLWFRQTIAHQWDIFQTKETTTHRHLSHQFTRAFKRNTNSKHVNINLERSTCACITHLRKESFFCEGNKPQNRCKETYEKKNRKKTRTNVWRLRLLKLWFQSKPKKLLYFGNQIITESKRCARKMLFKRPTEYVWSNLKRKKKTIYNK